MPRAKKPKGRKGRKPGSRAHLSREERTAEREARRSANRETHMAAQAAIRQQFNTRPLHFIPFEQFETDESRESPPTEGRPTGYSPALAEYICYVIATNVASTARLCREVPDFPGLMALIRWRNEFDGFDEKFQRAKEMQADLMAEETIDIADTPQEGITTTEKETFVETKTEDMLGHRRLQVDTRKWFASKMNPKYSDKLDISGGLDNTNLERDPDSLTDAELENIARRGRTARPEPEKGKK